MNELDAIRARLDGATPGPWWFGYYGSGGELPEGCEVTNGKGALDLGTKKADAEFIANAPADIARLLAAVDAVSALHQPEKRWTHPEWTGSFDTREEAAEYDYDEAIGDPANSQVSHFEVCTECARTESEQLREAGDGDWTYRESLWPCKTFIALTAALGGWE